MVQKQVEEALTRLMANLGLKLEEVEVEQEAVGVPSVERAAVSEKEIRMFEARERGLAGAADKV